MRWPLWLPTALLASFGSAAVRDLGPASPSVPERLPSLLSQPVWTLPTPELTADRPQPETVHPLIIEPLWFERRMVSARTHVGKPKREVVESFSIRWNIDDRRDKSRWTSSMEKAESFFERLDKSNTSKGVFAPAQRRVIVTARGKNLLEMDPEERAAEGVFLAFQYPVEIPGVSNTYFLRAALNAVRKHRGQPEVSMTEFMRIVREKAKLMELPDNMLSRAVNEGFSGGEKKRNEIFQMAVLEPTLCVLDETDSGLDIDALKIVDNGVNSLRSPERAVVVVTHYQRLLDYIVPDFVHVLMQGRVVRSGGKELALELEEHGYSFIEEEVAARA